MESTLQAITRPLGVLIHPCHKLLALCLSFLLPFFCKPTASLIAKAPFREQAESQGGGTPSSHRMSLLLPHFSYPHHAWLMSRGMRSGSRTRVTVGGLINHHGTDGALAGPGFPVAGVRLVARTGRGGCQREKF